MTQSHTLNYEAQEANPRPTWVYVVIALYLALVLGLLALGGWMATELWRGSWLVSSLALSVVAVPFLAGGWLLILVPIRAQRRRPVTRRSIWLPLIGSVILFAALCYGGALATIEMLNAHHELGRLAITIYCVAGVVWLLWGIAFWWISRSLDPQSFSAIVYKSLFAGSLIELVVAVPMHLAVRRRTECCAGIYTASAICLGTVTAILSMGPGIFFLYHRRWKQVYRPEIQQPLTHPEGQVR